MWKSSSKICKLFVEVRYLSLVYKSFLYGFYVLLIIKSEKGWENQNEKKKKCVIHLWHKKHLKSTTKIIIRDCVYLATSLLVIIKVQCVSVSEHSMFQLRRTTRWHIITTQNLHCPHIGIKEYYCREKKKKKLRRKQFSQLIFKFLHF